ncbi:MAG: 30S ribosomal protein S4e [Thermoplasmata archaeon]|nr:30S ribosomal protein S4e [Thermoplasmata archaeon]
MKRNMKRYTTPRSWPIPRKTHFWAVKPRPGPHPTDRSLPLLVVLRDILKEATTAAEARKILSQGQVVVDGVVRKDRKFPVGLMDVVFLPKIKKHYRVFLDRHGRVTLKEIEEAEARWKLCRIENKTTVKGGNIQLNLHDGRNILIPKNKDVYKTGDVLKIAVPSQEILEHIPFREGMMAYLIGGAHVGEIGRIKSYEVTRSPLPNVVNFEEGFTTIKDYVFVVGGKSPVLSLPEVKVVEKEVA